MYRAKSIKKKTRNRLILLQNLKKGKARKEARCAFQLIPYPQKFSCSAKIHYLYGDVVLMEYQDTIVSEVSLFNNFKVYKNAQVIDSPGQKVMKLKVESRNIQPDDWRKIVEKFENSESSQMKEWAELVKNFGERYETGIQNLQKEQQEMSPRKYQSLLDLNTRAEKLRQNIIKTYPCVEYKSQLKDGHIQFTEVSVNEKYVSEIGYSFETFARTVLEEGLPEVTPLNSPGASSIAKLRLQRCLTIDQDEYQTPEFESYFLMKNGYIKKIRLRIHYLPYFEKGVLGFGFIGVMLSKQKPEVRDSISVGECNLNRGFVEMMAEREKEMNAFLSTFYNQTADLKFANLYQTCKIKEIKKSDDDEL